MGNNINFFMGFQLKLFKIEFFAHTVAVLLYAGLGKLVKLADFVANKALDQVEKTCFLVFSRVHLVDRSDSFDLVYCVFLDLLQQRVDPALEARELLVLRVPWRAIGALVGRVGLVLAAAVDVLPDAGLAYAPEPGADRSVELALVRYGKLGPLVPDLFPQVFELLDVALQLEVLLRHQQQEVTGLLVEELGKG